MVVVCKEAGAFAPAFVLGRTYLLNYPWWGLGLPLSAAGDRKGTPLQIQKIRAHTHKSWLILTSVPAKVGISVTSTLLLKRV